MRTAIRFSTSDVPAPQRLMGMEQLLWPVIVGASPRAQEIA